MIKINVGYIAENIPATSIPNARKCSIYVDRFLDNRKDAIPNIVGEGKSGIAKKVTPIGIDQELSSLTTSFFEDAFDAMGFVVLESDTNANLIFRGRINRFWLQEYASGLSDEYCEGIIELDIAIFKQGTENPTWFDVKRNSVKSQKVTFDITAYDERILNETTNKAITSIVKDTDFISALRELCDFSNVD